LLISPR